ncbi:MAG: type II toxin-antitoxin system RelB/DinJ family antitoxin [Clostridia bacterium]|nr:type II toxin-antitoxin system RelB/DinJ family antitoxin [Clostridia bacterium]
MATITARVDDKIKAQAEEIANAIGLNLSSVINVFITRFVAERGFPFAVSDPKTVQMFDRTDLADAVSKAIRERHDVPEVPKSYCTVPGTDTDV